MGSARWQASDIIEASPDDVFAWMSDFTAEDHSSEAFKRGAGVDPNKKQKTSKRTVLSRDGNVLKVKDEWGRSSYTLTVTLDPTRRTVRIQSGFGYDSMWTAASEGTGTRVTVTGQMGKGFIGSIMKLFEAQTQKSMEKDFRGHMEDLRETLRTEAKGGV